MRTLLLASLLLLAGAMLAGCASDGARSDEVLPPAADATPFLGYLPAAPDMGLRLLESEALLPGEGVDIHVRVKRPDVDGPVPVIVQFTPYTAGIGAFGSNPALNGLIEPAVGCAGFGLGACEGVFDREFVRRGYAFAYADVRGTGDSSGCLDLRGKGDLADAAHLTKWLGTQPWSNGNVGFIGASYPGSEAHIAAIAEAAAGTGHLKAVVPVVASTSFYHYHHNDGVPYNGNHALGGTNAGYTGNAVAPTINPQNPNYLARQLEEATCPHAENIAVHGGLDQSGAYYAWWQERNLRGHAPAVTVPVLMAQGLADWNVKPDHIATYWNDLPTDKTLIAGQWGHQYPRSAGTCGSYDAAAGCDPAIPWGNWWEYVTAFFDTYLKGIATGMFGGSTAWVQDNAGTWHRSSTWPILDAPSLELHLAPSVPAPDGTWSSVSPNARLSGEPPAEGAAMPWTACPRDQHNRGTALAVAEEQLAMCSSAAVQQLVFDSEPFAADTILSGVGTVRLTLTSTAPTHLVVVLQRLEGDRVVEARENYGYLNPVYREGLEHPQDVPAGQPYQVTIDLYPQEDVVRAGQSLRLVVRSNDDGRTIEAYEPGTNTLLLGPGHENVLRLPVRPAELQGVRLSQ
ncbi:MAG TPA: CocE/NonD family hydrolase [Candidatus Thermoplasmatota archaeon]|nr:CocE/NonD family hydrolase [Candidatus Thermoplasmatota archaeon]